MSLCGERFADVRSWFLAALMIFCKLISGCNGFLPYICGINLFDFSIQHFVSALSAKKPTRTIYSGNYSSIFRWFVKKKRRNKRLLGDPWVGVCNRDSCNGQSQPWLSHCAFIFLLIRPSAGVAKRIRIYFAARSIFLFSFIPPLARPSRATKRSFLLSLGRVTKFKKIIF